MYKILFSILSSIRFSKTDNDHVNNLIDWLRNNRQATEEQLKQSALNSGYTLEEFNQALLAFNQSKWNRLIRNKKQLYILIIPVASFVISLFLSQKYASDEAMGALAVTIASFFLNFSVALPVLWHGLLTTSSGRKKFLFTFGIIVSLIAIQPFVLLYVLWFVSLPFTK